MRAEGPEPVRHEALEGRQRLAPGHGEDARTVDADGGDDALARPAVQVVAHLGVDVVLARPVGRWHVETLHAPGRGLAVLLVEGPPTADRPVALDEQVEPLPLEAVEVLHAQLAPVARPPREVAAGQAVARRRVDGLDQAGSEEPAHEPLGGI